MAVEILAGICFSIWILFAYAGYKILHKPKKETEFFNSIKLEREIHDLNEMINRIEQLDSMIIDLGLCKPAEALRSFRMEWQGAAGVQHGLDFMADGRSDSSTHLMELAQAERAELNAQVALRIADIYAKACALSAYDEMDRAA